jgi:hypothetical protein
MYQLRSRTTLNAEEESIVKLKFMEKFLRAPFLSYIQICYISCNYNIINIL